MRLSQERLHHGWSSSRRARSTANSGIVVELELADFKAYEADYGPLVAMAFQADIERKAWEAGGYTQPRRRRLVILSSANIQRSPDILCARA